MVYSWGTSRRFNAYSDFFKNRFGGRVQKLSIDAGFTCPNRDGKISRGGCTYCDNQAFSPSYTASGKSVTEQLEEGISFHKKRYRKVNQFLAYFQSFSNTYAPLDDLKKIYQEAIDYPGVIGIIIGTRPDCIDEEMLDYFAKISEKKFLVIEYGIESVYNKTLQSINRGHTFETTVKTIHDTAGRNILVGGHLIIGLPGERTEDWHRTIDYLNDLPLHSIKFHQLQVIKGTVMARQYEKNPGDFYDFGLDEYLQLMVDLVERLNPEIVLERIAGEVNPNASIKEGWGIRYDQVLKRFDQILEERDSWQGKSYR